MLLALSGALLVGCSNGSSPYPAAVRTNFVNACVGAGSSEAYCGCTFDWIAKNVSYQDFVKFDSAMQNDPNATPPSWLNDALTACA